VLGPHEPFDIGLPGALALFYGHIGNGNLHIVACLPGASLQPKAQIQDIVYRAVREFGGSISAEHGIGLTKKPWLPFTRNPPEIALMERIKASPGKVV
jgi:FAD/FMN-containing dehydrogenase